MGQKIAIIGGGNLGVAIAQGLINSQFSAPQDITVTRRNIQLLSDLKAVGVNVTTDNCAAVREATWVVIAVKPFQIQEILMQLTAVLEEDKHKLISVVTGVWLDDLQNMVASKNLSLFRAMPNTAIAIGESMTCICSRNAREHEEQFVNDLFNQLGKSVIIDEKLMDAATVLGACGTAYAMRYIRANIQGGIEIGFSAKLAALIAAQTVKGASELLLRNNTHPEQEIDKVTTPKGCTIAGLNEMEHRGFSSSLIRGVTTSYKKITQDM